MIAAWPLRALVITALTVGAAASADAETIQLTILAQHTVSAGGLRVHLDVRNNGDAAARNVMPIATFRGEESLGTFTPALNPQSSLLQTITIPLSNAAAMRGTWPLFIRLPYADSNNHPFEALHIVSIPFGEAAPADGAAPVSVDLSGAAITTTGEISARLQSTIDGNASLTFIVPAGIAVTPENATLFLNPGTRRINAFVTNAGATESSQLPVFAVLEYESAGRHTTAIANAVVEIAPERDLGVRNILLIAFAALMILWAFLAFVRPRLTRGRS